MPPKRAATRRQPVKWSTGKATLPPSWAGVSLLLETIEAQAHQVAALGLGVGPSGIGLIPCPHRTEQGGSVAAPAGAILLGDRSVRVRSRPHLQASHGRRTRWFDADRVQELAARETGP